MAETETMAPRKMAFEITVPYTMGTLDKKRIGLTSWAEQRNLRQAKGNCQRAGRGGWESNARRNARRRLTAERAPGSLQSNVGWAPARRQLWPKCRGAESWGRRAEDAGICRRWRRRPTCAHSEARAWIAQRPSDHREMHESLCTDGGTREGRSSAGAQGRRAE